MIAIDWGSTSLRAYRIDDFGSVREQRRADIGALGQDGHHATILATQIAGWDDECIALCGMVGARGGWHEAAYVDCPADTRSIAAQMLDVAVDRSPLHGRSVRIVPGVIDRGGHDRVGFDRVTNGVADVMRGEETQVIGLIHGASDPPDAVCLPGTHSKWVSLRDGAITSVCTAMTGEAYALLRRQSVLARLMSAEDAPFDAASFDAGVRRSGEPGGLLHHLFGVRTQGLLGRVSPEQAPAYLSGMLIGHEIRARLPLPAIVHLIASDHLANAYARALANLGTEARVHPEGLAARGMFALLQAQSQ
ncbi:MAG: 2-dehydro-3-deoxygalactonokinase [Rudaea sp.]